jgi:hypothetical protein
MTCPCSVVGFAVFLVFRATGSWRDSRKEIKKPTRKKTLRVLVRVGLLVNEPFGRGRNAFQLVIRQSTVHSILKYKTASTSKCTADQEGKQIAVWRSNSILRLTNNQKRLNQFNVEASSNPEPTAKTLLTNEHATQFRTLLCNSAFLCNSSRSSVESRLNEDVDCQRECPG